MLLVPGEEFCLTKYEESLYQRRKLLMPPDLFSQENLEYIIAHMQSSTSFLSNGTRQRMNGVRGVVAEILANQCLSYTLKTLHKDNSDYYCTQALDNEGRKSWIVANDEDHILKVINGHNVVLLNRVPGLNGTDEKFGMRNQIELDGFFFCGMKRRHLDSKQKAIYIVDTKSSRYKSVSERAEKVRTALDVIREMRPDSTVTYLVIGFPENVYTGKKVKTIDKRFMGLYDAIEESPEEVASQRIPTRFSVVSFPFKKEQLSAFLDSLVGRYDGIRRGMAVYEERSGMISVTLPNGEILRGTFLPQ